MWWWAGVQSIGWRISRFWALVLRCCGHHHKTALRYHRVAFRLTQLTCSFSLQFCAVFWGGMAAARYARCSYDRCKSLNPYIYLAVCCLITVYWSCTLLQGCRKNAAKGKPTAEICTTDTWLHCGTHVLYDVSLSCGSLANLNEHLAIDSLACECEVIVQALARA